jgi:NAD-dependent deacetylase
MDTKKIYQAAKIIARAKHMVALTGAGISTPSGIPDFRSPGSGLWDRADPMAVASIWGFLEHPQGFYDWVKPLARKILDAEPNPAHRALAQLESLGRLNAIITQNIDNLHQRAGSKRVLELHGHLREATCIRCYHMMPARTMIEQFLGDGQVPRCPECGSVMKPNVVLFGEMLPVGVMNDAEEESRTCDVMLVAGSSLEVAPAAELPHLARKNGARLIIVNKTSTPADRLASIVLREDVAIALPRILQEI